MDSAWVRGALVSALGMAACSVEKETPPAVGDGGVPAGAQVATADARTAEDLGLELGEEGVELGAPIRRANLIAWPILGPARATPPEGARDYLTLDEALESGSARVLETGQVNELALENGSDRPVFVLAGEVLKGGQQDRIVGKDLVIGPGEKAPLSSFCVEHGRWSAREGDAGGGKSFESAKALASTHVRYSAQVASDQSGVWASTAAVNAMAMVAPSTGTYTATLEAPDVQRGVDEIAAPILEALREQSGVRGLVLAVDPGDEHELVCAELFGGEPLFRALEEKLVRAYALDAVTRQAAREKPELLASRDLAQSWSGAQQREQVLNLRIGAQQAAQVQTLGYGGGGDVNALQIAPAGSASAAAPPSNVSSAPLTATTPGLEHLHRTIYRRR